MGGIQRKGNYKVKFSFSDASVEALIDTFTPPDFTREIGSYKNQEKGHLTPEGNASFSEVSFTAALFYGESSNTTATLINKLYEVDATNDSFFNIEVSMIEQVGGAESPNYIFTLVDCKLASIKYDDVGTDMEDIMKVTITVQPRTMGKVLGDEIS